MKIRTKNGEGMMLPGIPEPVLVSGRGTAIGMEGYVFYTVNGRQLVRTYTKPKDSRTKKQLGRRKLFAEAVQKWKELPLEERREYNRRAEKRHMNGFNLFISETVKDRQKAGGY
jgi:hypothetical protein